MMKNHEFRGHIRLQCKYTPLEKLSFGKAPAFDQTCTCSPTSKASNKWLLIGPVNACTVTEMPS